ncbi:unnamed protein product [Calypogeia fissa]
MLPTSQRGRSASSYRNNSVMPQYLRRIVKVTKWKVWKWQQMDIEYTFWQMLHLCTSPKVVYQHTKYHKQTKNQWARDDPAFVVICCLLQAVAAAAFCLAYGGSVAHTGFTILSVVFLHFLLIGASLATIFWFLSNHYLREEAAVHSHVVEQRVEWLYAFDVHCNAYFPLFVLLYVLQFFLSPLLLAQGFIPTLLSNLLYVVALCYYHYLNFLGYDVLPFLERTTVFLYPVALLIILFPFSVLAGFNPTRFALSFYFG